MVRHADCLSQGDPCKHTHHHQQAAAHCLDGRRYELLPLLVHRLLHGAMLPRIMGVTNTCSRPSVAALWLTSWRCRAPSSATMCSSCARYCALNLVMRWCRGGTPLLRIFAPASPLMRFLRSGAYIRTVALSMAVLYTDGHAPWVPLSVYLVLICRCWLGGLP